MTKYDCKLFWNFWLFARVKTCTLILISTTQVYSDKETQTNFSEAVKIEEWPHFDKIEREWKKKKDK